MLFEDNNVDYDNCNIYAMRQKIATLEKQLADSEAQNKRVLEKLDLIVRSNQELEIALELAVADKCRAENIIAESFVGKGAKIAVPKKEQWYIEQAQKEIKNG